MQQLNNKNQLLELLAQGATVITPNNRLSNNFLNQYFRYCDHKTVVKPFCQPYGSLLINTYHQLQTIEFKSAHPILLNNVQCHHLWRKIIKSTTEVTFSQGLLNAVIEAWTHCEQWEINPDNHDFCYTPQTQQFQQWWNLFNQKLKQSHLINEHQLIPYLLEKEPIWLQRPVVWACFDDFTPQQRSLQNYLVGTEQEQYHYDLHKQTTPVHVLAAEDNLDERHQLVAWIQTQLQQGHQRIGVVVPDLKQQSCSLQRTLEHHFEPSLFDMSLGKSLDEFPLISHALCWLNLDPIQCTHQHATLILQSPYIGSAKEEFINRSQYLQDGLLLNAHRVPLKSLSNDLKLIAPKCSDFLNNINAYPPSASPEQWVSVFQERLNNIGFPGDYGLNSENYQCYNRFTTLFDEFRQLQLVSPILSAKEALDALTELLKNTIFQAQKTNASIQISGLLEASGCEFDSLWVMGLTDQCLPQKTRLSAFIPLSMQKELVMPHSEPSRELQFAKQILQRLQRGSKHTTVFSFPQFQGDSPNLPCSLITKFPNYIPCSLLRSNTKSSSLIEFQETYNVPLNSGERISGGTSLLANQAKCPFKSFAEYRLIAKPLQQVSEGMDNKEKGKVIHKVLELLWHRLKNQSALFNLSTQQLNAYIDEAILHAITPLEQLRPNSAPILMQEIEFTRLKRLVLSCLEWEKQRSFFEVAAIEQSYSINLAGLDIALRVDRLDQVEEKKWVIDYKSTLPSYKPWNEERPKEPQLLLYALLDEQINTILLMQVKTGSIICAGLSENKNEIKGISSLKKDETWKSSKEKWEHQLTQLAEEIQSGHCPPQPANPTICTHCDFQNLCRIQQT